MAKTEILSPAVRVKINNEWVELPALKGEKGDAASTIRVGEVRSGSTASVVNSGTVNDVVLDFVLPKGDRGLQGIQGERGLQGEPGPKGEKGEKGDRGERGMQGIQGKQGLQGIQGEKGDKGDKGDRGLQGIKGDPLTWDDLTEEQKASLKGEKGDDGPVYTFYMRDLQFDQGASADSTLDDEIILTGYFFIDGNVPLNYGDYILKAYCKEDNQDWVEAKKVEWVEDGNHRIFPKVVFNASHHIDGIRLSFFRNSSIVHSVYFRIPRNGEKGDPLTWDDLTEEQKASLKGEQGIQGEPGPKGDKGDKGDKGLQGIRGPEGPQGIQGVKGDKGKNADSYTFAVGKLYWDEATKNTFLIGNLFVNGEEKGGYDVNAYCRRVNQGQSSFEKAQQYNWDGPNNRLVVTFSGSQEDNIKEIRLDFLNNSLNHMPVVYSYYMQVPKDGKDGQNGNDGQNAPVYTFEVKRLYWDKAVNYTFLKGYLVVNGERKSDYNVEGYCRRVNQSQSSWESAQQCLFNPNGNNELTVLFSGSQEDNIKEIRLDFLKNGSVVYSHYMQTPKDGKTGEAATVQVGTVTEGDTVSVVNVGDEHNAILNFTLKKGKDYEIEVRDAVSLMKGGLSLEEALSTIGVELLGAGDLNPNETGGVSPRFQQRYRLPTIPVGDVVYFAIPYPAGANVAFFPPSEGKYLFDDRIHPMPLSDRYGYYYTDKGVKIITNPDWDDGNIEQVKLQRYE